MGGTLSSTKPVNSLSIKCLMTAGFGRQGQSLSPGNYTINRVKYSPNYPHNYTRYAKSKRDIRLPKNKTSSSSSSKRYLFRCAVNNDKLLSIVQLLTQSQWHKFSVIYMDNMVYIMIYCCEH